MADWKVGTCVEFRRLSPVLGTFRLMPEPGHRFPSSEAGQYIALRREDCRLTRRVVGPDRNSRYVLDVDQEGNARRGPVAHSYSISSAPYETAEHGWLEFYVILEVTEEQHEGRLTESLFRLDPNGDNRVCYANRIVGDFTLAKRAEGFKNVILVGTGTGLAPFASMAKQLAWAASKGNTDGVRYTLVHANRAFTELAYHDELLAIAKTGHFDFVYVASVSRPTPRDLQDPELGGGRANNLLRFMLGMPLREEEELQEAALATGSDLAVVRAALERTVPPRLPSHLTRDVLKERLEASQTVVLTCGNPSAMADIKRIADAHGMHFEKEDW